MSKETKVKKTEPKKQGATKTLTRQMRRRVLVVMVVLVILCSGGVTAQLFSLQILQSEYLQRGAVTQQLSDITISPNRGQIFDANMSILALTREVCTVIMSPKNIPDEETREMIVEELGTLLDVDREKLREQASDSASQYKVVKAKIDKSLGDTFIDWVEEKKLGAVFRVITDYKREYPMNNLLSSVLGFVGADNLAKEGLEVKYDEVLSGTPGRLVTALNAWGDELPTRLPYENTVDAEDGYSLVLTVDQTIQQITEKYLEEAINQYAAKNRGAAIVMDVQTGAILAMATKKDYNPNDYLTIADPDVATSNPRPWSKPATSSTGTRRSPTFTSRARFSRPSPPPSGWRKGSSVRIRGLPARGITPCPASSRCAATCTPRITAIRILSRPLPIPATRCL